MSQAPTPKLTLEITPPGQPAVVRVVHAERTIIGRESGDIELRDSEASALHAEIDCSGGHAIVRDLGSSNGTWRDGKRLPQFALYEGQTFYCGKTAIRLSKIEGSFPVAKAGQTSVGNRAEVPPAASQTLTRGTPEHVPEPAPDPLLSTLVGGPTLPEAPAKFDPPPGWSTPTGPGADKPPEEIWPATPSSTRVAGGAPAPPPSAPVEAPPPASQANRVTDVEIPPLGRPAPTVSVPDTGNYAPVPATRVDVPAPDAPSTVTTAAPPSSTRTAPAKSARSETMVAPPTTAATALAGAGPTTSIPDEAPPEIPPAASQTLVAGAAATSSVAAAPAEAPPAPQPVELSPAPLSPSKGDRRGPVANAVIKEPGALGGARTNTDPLRTSSRRNWRRLLAIAGITTLVVGGLGAAAYFVYGLVAGRSLAFTEEVASALPNDTVGVVSAASPQAVLDLFGDAVPAGARAEASDTIGFDVFDASAWTELGVDPKAPVGLALLSIDPPVLALSVGAKDTEALWASSSKLALKHAGAAEDSVVSRRSFGNAEGWWLAEPTPAAGVFVGDRFTLVWSPSRPDPDLIEAKAKAIAAASSGESLATRPGFDQLVPPAGKTVSTVFVDSGSLSAGLPGSALTTMAVRMALADIDGFAASLSYKGKDIYLGQQMIVRDGARHLEVAETKGRKQRGIGRLPAPVLASLDGRFNPEAFDRSLSGLASVAGGSLSLFEAKFVETLGVDLRTDVMQNLSGDFGWALVHLPSAPDMTGLSGVAWLGVEDEEKARSDLKQAAANISAFGVTIDFEVVGDTDVLVWDVPDRKIRIFAADGSIWLAFGDMDINPIIAGPDEAFFEEPRHDEIARAVRKGGLIAGFVDIQGLLKGAEPLFSSREREDLEKAATIVEALEVLSLRVELRNRTFVSQLTLHTSTSDALPSLIQEGMRLTGDELASSVASAARSEKCAALAEHVVGLTREALEKKGSDLDEAWEVERKADAECPKMSAARLDCYLASTSIEDMQVCDARHPSTAAGGDEGGAHASGDEGGAKPVEPKPVPYVEDIWPHLGDDPDSEKPQPEVNYGVPVGNDPQTRGPEDALVTIIEFGDFECPYCKRVSSTVDEVLAAHGKDVRFVFRHNPLERLHKNARLAAQAAIAAGKQGKFWDLHDKMFENQKQLGEAQLRKMAESLGLDMKRFDRDFYDAATDRHLQRDIDAAKKFGASGTPAFFVNGRYLGGAQTKSAFDAVIAEEKARAEKFVERRGSTRVRLYEDMLSHFAPKVLKPTSAVAPIDADEKRYLVSTKDLPQKGATGFARVQIVECGDFDCPFCARVRKTIDKVLAAYPSQVSFFFAHDPLSFHAGAEAAARAAVAANNQDKFWEMHDTLFEGQDGSTRVAADFSRYAKKLGLDVPRFEKDFAATETAETVEAQRKACVDNEGNATPTFFFNGRRVTGALELAGFKALIDEELAAGI